MTGRHVSSPLAGLGTTCLLMKKEKIKGKCADATRRDEKETEMNEKRRNKMKKTKPQDIAPEVQLSLPVTELVGFCFDHFDRLGELRPL